MSFPRYERYKESGVEWLGEVPAHWEVQRLKNLIDRIESGTSVNSVDTPADEGEFGVLKTSCVYRGRFDPEENKAVVPEDYGRLSCPVVAGTLIASRMNTPDLVGAAGVVRESHKNLFLPDRLWQVYFKNAAAEYVHYWTNTRSYRMQVEMACAGTSSSMQNLGQDEFRVFVLARPPLAEQRAIASFLDHETAKIDALVEEQKRLIELLKEKRQAVISHAVTKGLNPNAPMKDSGVEWLGEVPAHWHVLPLKYFADIGNGSTPNRDRADYWCPTGFPWLSSTVVNQDEVTQADEFVTALALAECHLPRVQPPAILIGITGQGRTRGMATTLMIEATINQHIAYARPRGETIKLGYLRRLFDMAYSKLRADSEAGGSTKAAITCDQIANLRFPLPPAAEQDEVAQAIALEAVKFDALAEDATQAMSLLQERRTALISAAVTGKIDVRNSAQRLG